MDRCFKQFMASDMKTYNKMKETIAKAGTIVWPDATIQIKTVS